MSRSNNLRLCKGPLDEQGHCKWHESFLSPWTGKYHVLSACTVPRDIYGRRSFKRRTRYPKFSVKRWHNPPPPDLQAIWSRQARAKQKQEFLRNPADPVITPRKRLIDLWDWY